ncbi:MAG: L,D-transpeptidase [Methylacidiphilales bacterium]|nr:L,D-transpeptidase [Candidatus Methylacidiphilales bacterium]
MKCIMTISIALLSVVPFARAMPQPSFHTKGSPTGKPTGPLKPGEYWWAPHVAPAGPVVVLVSIPQQIMCVYRNGVLVGRTSVSTGSKGHETPAGVFTILEKNDTHYSKTYNNAPMPHMQRLTWSGIAMHSGQLPGYAASHGCIRMPYDFSKLLFGLTAKGGTVVIGDEKTPQPHFAANPGILLAPKDVTPDMLRPLEKGEYQWNPQRSPEGQISVLFSGADRMVYVYRNGQPIGRAPIEIIGRGPLGGHVFSMLEGATGKASWWSSSRSAYRWMTVSTDRTRGVSNFEDLGKRVRINPEFAVKLHDVLKPGTSVIVTDQPAAPRAGNNFPILAN